MSNATIQDIGVKVRWIGDSLQVSPPIWKLSEAQKLAVAAYKAAVLEKKREEEAALFEIALEYAKQFADDALKLLGNFKLVHLPGLHETYCQSLARVMKHLVPPIGRAAFDEVLLQVEADKERHAIQAADNPNQREHLTERHL